MLSKVIKSNSYLIFVLFGNLWLYQALKVNILTALFLILATVVLWKGIVARGRKNIFMYVLIFIFCVASLLQFKATDVGSLTNLSNDQIRQRDMRLTEYPPVKFTLFTKTLWIPIANWFENRNESIAFFRVLKNLSENLDINLYFFGNHPRERLTIKEFEKFPYVFLPFFLYGLVIMLKDRRIIIGIWISVSLLLLSFIGNLSVFGPIILFPAIVVITALGMEKLHKSLKLFSKQGYKYGTIIYIVYYFLVLIEMISYTIA